MMRRQPVGLASDPATPLGVRRRDGAEKREVVGLGQPPAAACDSAERHVCLFCYAGIILFVCKLE